jgi:4-amino-4-deoxy-L-arabinose transferase-like glycosyltransferase
MMEKMIKLIKKHFPQKNILILLLANFVLYLPALFEPLSYGDECIYLVLGNALRKGLVFYRDIHDNKPPLLYVTAAIAGNSLFWFRLISIVVNLIHIDLVYSLIKKLTKKKQLPILGAIIFSFLLLILEGRVANGEIFMSTAATLAVYLYFSNPQKTNFKWGVVLGTIFSVGFLYKIPIAFDFVGIVLAIYFLNLKSISKKILLRLAGDKKLWGMIIGFIGPILASIAYYAAKGAFTPYVRSALMQNIGYLSSWQGGSGELLWRLIILSSLTVLVFVLRKKIDFHVAFFFYWFIFSLFGALLSGRPYPHYLIEISSPLTILTILLLEKTQFRKNIGNYLVGLTAILLAVFSYFHYQFWWYPQVSYYKNFISKLFGATDQQYTSYWGDRALENQKLARLIKEITLPSDNIFVWGEASCTYALSNRFPPGRYMVNYHIFDFNGYEQTLKAIEEKKPKLIIKLKEERERWPELDLFLEKHYLPLVSDQLIDKIYLLNEANLE